MFVAKHSLRSKIFESRLFCFIEERLPCASVVVTVNEEVGYGFNIMTTAANWIYANLKIISKVVIN